MNEANTSVDTTTVIERIYQILEHHGFKRVPDGSMVRFSTGCEFSFACLSKYETVVDFQLDWPYS